MARECGFSRSNRELAIRTVAWHYRCLLDPPDAAARGRLFAKPSDRWEVNDVAARMPQVVESLEELARQAAANGSANLVQALAAELTTIVD